MAGTRSWISGFLTRHRARFSPNDWPDAANSEENLEFVRGWVTQFNLKEVTEDEADRASLDLVANPPRFRPEHIPAVLKAIEANRRLQGHSATGGAGPSGSREEAEYQSRDCDDCCGKSGLTIRWHPAPDPARRIGPTLTGYCGCALGRWVKRTHAQKSPELARFFIDVTDEDHKRVSWRRDPLADHTMGGHRHGTEPQRVYYDGTSNRKSVDGPKGWQGPFAKNEPVAIKGPIDTAMNRAAVNKMFTPAPNQDGFSSEASTADAQPF